MAQAQQPDYRSIKVPEGKHPDEYTWQQRRAEILKLIEKAGHPYALNQAELARRYDTSRQNIHHDFQRIREYELEHIDTDRMDYITHTGYHTAIRELMAEGEYEAATRALDRLNKWLFNRGHVEKEPERFEGDVDIRKKEAKVYAGVDLTKMPGVEPSRVVGMEFAEEGDVPDDVMAGDALEIPLDDTGGDDDD